MSEIKDGGPAFPMPANEYAGHGPAWGMSLRDYAAIKFAAAASAGPIQTSGTEKHYIAMHAYSMADAMLAAREQS